MKEGEKFKTLGIPLYAGFTILGFLCNSEA
jgi:hypothetical protein